MEKKIITVSALCFFMIGAITAAGILIEAETIRRIVVIAGCLVVVWLTSLNFKYLKCMKQQTADLTPEIPSLIHWLQGETWPEVLSAEKVETHFASALASFLQTHPSCTKDTVKGFRIWRTQDTEKYFEESNLHQQQLLVLMDESGETFQVFGSQLLQKEMEEHAK